MARRPNIVLTIADDHRYDALGFLGLEPVCTPHLDRLAERGTCYGNAWLPGSTHGAVCAPSRAMLHTGRSLFHTSDSLRAIESPTLARKPAPGAPPLPTLGQRLRDAGYVTFGTGKWHNEPESFIRSFQFGRRVFYGGMCSHFCVGSVDYGPDTAHPPQRGGIAGHSTDIFSGAAVDFLRSLDPGEDRPFFLYVAFTAPHDPRETVWHWRNRYRAQDMPVPPSFVPEHPFDLGVRDIRDELLAEYPRTPEEIRQHIADYYAITSHMDEGIGRIHMALEELGLSDNTVVVHTADHGIAIGRHGLMGKQSVYDHSIHVPLLIAGPGIEQSRRDDRLAYMQDLHPTLLAAAGIEFEPSQTDFQSLDGESRRDFLGNGYADTQRTIRDAVHKLNVFNIDGQCRRQLFDLSRDRHETRDLIDDPGNAATVERLGRALRDWQAQSDDPFVDRFA